MIRSSLPELIIERRFGPLRIGQELTEVRSAFADVPNLDSFWTPVRIRNYKVGFFDFGGLDIHAEPDASGVLRIHAILLKPRSEECGAGDKLVRFEFDYCGLDAHQTLEESLRLLEQYGLTPELRIHEFVSYWVGESTVANFNLDDEEDPFGPARLYSFDLTARANARSSTASA